MKTRAPKNKIVTLLMISLLTGSIAAWGYWHFVDTSRYDFVTNATRL